VFVFTSVHLLVQTAVEKSGAQLQEVRLLDSLSAGQALPLCFI
jgi:hypothetical protein